MAEITRKDYEELGQTLVTVQEELVAARKTNDAALKAMQDKVTADVEVVRKAVEEVGKSRKLSVLANDYGLEGRSLAERVITDPGPSARAMKGEILDRTSRQVLDHQELCDNMLIFASCAGIKDLTDANLEHALCADPKTASEAGRRAWIRFKQMRVDFGATDVEFASTGWIPTVTSPQLQNRYTLALKVAALFQEVTIPHSPFEFPVLWARDSMAYAMPGEALADTARYTNILGTGLKMTFTAKKFHRASYVSDESNWETIVALAPVIIADHADFLAYCDEYCIINGDTSGTHQDTDIEASGAGSGATHAAAAWKGLRKLGLGGSCSTDMGGDGSEYTIADLRSPRASMGVYGVNPSESPLVVCPTGYIKMLSINEVKTVDVFGPQATVVSGELAKIDGHPVIVSEASRDELDSNGVNAASDNVHHAIIYVNTKMFKRARRMGFETKYSDTALMLYGAHAFVSQKRGDFQPQLTPSTTNSTVWIGYNIAN